MIVGGFKSLTTPQGPEKLIEVYDLNTGEWHTLESMNEAAAEQALVSLNDGRVMAIGGTNDSNEEILA